MKLEILAVIRCSWSSFWPIEVLRHVGIGAENMSANWAYQASTLAGYRKGTILGFKILKVLAGRLK